MDYTEHVKLLREAYPNATFKAVVRIEMPESEPGAGDAMAGNLDLADVDPQTAVDYVQMALDQQREKVRAERAEAIKAAEEYAASVERIHAPIIHLPGGGTHRCPDAHLIQTMAANRDRPPLAWG